MHQPLNGSGPGRNGPLQSIQTSPNGDFRVSIAITLQLQSSDFQKTWIGVRAWLVRSGFWLDDAIHTAVRSRSVGQQVVLDLGANNAGNNASGLLRTVLGALGGGRFCGVAHRSFRCRHVSGTKAPTRQDAHGNSERTNSNVGYGTQAHNPNKHQRSQRNTASRASFEHLVSKARINSGAVG